MNEGVSRRVYWLSVAAAVALQLIQMPYGLALFRPLLVAMVLAYWALADNHTTRLLAAWCTGVVIDVLTNSVFAQHALGFVLVVYVVKQFRTLITLFPLWQAGAVMLPLWLLFTVVMFWIDGATGHRADPWLRWLPPFTTPLFWPLIAGALHGMHRGSQRDASLL